MRRAAALVLVLLALSGCGSSRPERASGVTERWLQAVSDTGRKRVSADATRRARRDGDPELALAMLPETSSTHDAKAMLFDDLEVGRAIDDGDRSRVPFRVTFADDGSAIYRTAVLEARGDSWHVVAIEPSHPDERVPSKGGDRPAVASSRHWLAAIAVGGIVTVASALVIEAQPEPARTRQVAAPPG